MDEVDRGFLVFLAICGWLLWSFVNRAIAREKNRNDWGVLFASVFLSPLLIWLYIAAVPPLPPEPSVPARERSQGSIALTDVR